ncbi:MAG: acetyl-CoA carboxylase biotin carboxyl carrier protein subunit [Proteobacteria bacterium]|nr:acetyl-CoA carboxylase biotin carboxyl carrier protein subunit [Pseudomonadota bacterium]MBU1713130.1 acetyl-CoA carboxylase biotin carboxyl carrier protein subunit [Pseudomonadota bacterium]
MVYKINVDNMSFEIEVGELTGGTAQITVNGKPYKVIIEDYGNSNGGIVTAPVQTSAPEPVSPPVSTKPYVPAPAARASAPAGVGSVVAPIPGLILDIMVKVGDSVEAGDTVAIMEAMKMENNLVTNITGTVREINVQKEAQVNTGDLIMIIG